MIDPNESRKRRMEANYLISLEDPGRYSPQTRAGLQRFYDQGEGADRAVRREIEKIQAQGEVDVAKAETEGSWKGYAAQHQGEAAARETAAGSLGVAKEQKEAEIAKADAAVKAAEAQWGKVGEDGSGGAERVEAAKADAAVKAAEAQARGAVGAAEAAAKGTRDAAMFGAVRRENEREEAQRDKKELIRERAKFRLPTNEEMSEFMRENKDGKLDLAEWLMKRRGLAATNGEI